MSSALLLYGAAKQKPGFVLPWLVVKGIELVILAIAVPVLIGFAISWGTNDNVNAVSAEVKEAGLAILIGYAVWCGIWLGTKSH